MTSLLFFAVDSLDHMRARNRLQSKTFATKLLLPTAGCDIILQMVQKSVQKRADDELFVEKTRSVGHTHVHILPASIRIPRNCERLG